MCIVNKICKFAATFLQIILSATFGAIWSVVVIMMPVNIREFINICTYVVISFFMVRICACKAKLLEIAKGVVVLYGVTFVLSGSIHMLYYYTYAGYLVKTVILNSAELVLFVTVSVVLLYLIYIQYMRVKTYSRDKCRVLIECLGERVDLTGFVDTGNVLVDMYGKKPVSVAAKGEFCRFLKIENYHKLKYHLIPFRSLGCENGMLEVITVDNMYIYRGKEKIEIKEALIGLASMELSSDGEYQILVNSGVLKN